jgi:serralysin
MGRWGTPSGGNGWPSSIQAIPFYDYIDPSFNNGDESEFSILDDPRPDGDNVLILNYADPLISPDGFSQDIYVFDEKSGTVDIEVSPESSLYTAIIVIKDDDKPNNQISGTTADNLIYGQSNNGITSDTVFAGAGNDAIYTYEGNDIAFGEAGNDRLIDKVGSNFLYGGADNDFIYTGDGYDTLLGGDGNDILIGGKGDDLLDGGFGNDTLIGNQGNNTYGVDNLSDIIIDQSRYDIETVQSSINWTLDSGFDNLVLTGPGNINGAGNTLSNSITGNNQNNFLNGLEGDDILSGEDGDDQLIGGQGDDILYGDINVVLSDSKTSNDQLDGGDGNDQLNGGDGNDQLNGGDGNDTLNGGDGNNFFLGGDGDDNLIGASIANDVFQFNSSSEGFDSIEKFDVNQDKLYISQSGFGATSISQFTFEASNIAKTGLLLFNGEAFAQIEFDGTLSFAPADNIVFV